MTPVVLDTGVIVALLDRSERNHARCVEATESIAAPLVTCEAVIAEACYLLREIHGAADAVLDNVESGVFEIPFRLTGASRGIRLLMKRYARVPMDFADACLVQLADELGTGRILTLDSDFRIYRWRKQRAFDLLIN
ncbi:MAG: PIN domain-containing protein [Deltaproteobacteria bacterium]|nr:MAG: PIN domain-containing protein [Deltaproteobacteria bacterium]TMQ23002.1 MAG: PIN domain-containing protein [Deltaproteobacteria bacterium]